jgi:DNA-binding transcriptional LysR family regulator
MISQSRGCAAATELCGRVTEVQNIPEFDWNDLRYFLAVAREGSTLGAAKALGVSQPTVQRRLAALEQRVGCELIESRPTGYCLTHLGRELLPFAQNIEQEVLAFAREISARDKSFSGSIRITCPETDLPRLLKPIFDRFRTQFPEVRLEFLVTDRALDLSRGEADVALRGGQPKDQSLVGRKLADVLWLLYASRTYVKRHRFPEKLADFEKHSIVIYTGALGELTPGRWLRSVVPNAKIAAYSNSVSGSLSAVRSGLGLAMLPALVGSAESDLLCVWRPQPEVTEPFTLLVHPDMRKIPRVRALLDFIGNEIPTIRNLFRGEADTRT